jgi:hypothetical protein
MVLLAFLLLWCAPAMAGELPAVAGTNVAGDAMELPRDLPTQPTLVVFSFRRAHADLLDAWHAAAAEAGMGCVEVVVIQGAPGFVRTLIVRGLKKREGGETRQRRTLLATEGREEMLFKLKANNDAEPIAAITRSDGMILWQRPGAPDDAGRAKLRALADRFRKAPEGGGAPDEPAPAD